MHCNAGRTHAQPPSSFSSINRAMAPMLAPSQAKPDISQYTNVTWAARNERNEQTWYRPSGQLPKRVNLLEAQVRTIIGDKAMSVRQTYM